MLAKMEIEQHKREQLAAQFPVAAGFNCNACGTKETLHIAADACFKLRRELKVNIVKESTPRLSNFFIKGEEDEDKDKFHVSNSIQDKDTCASTFKAALTTVKSSKYVEKGIVGLFCARHGTPLLFLDTMYGERYWYIDLLLVRYLENRNHVREIIFFYDINCRYQAHFKKEGYYVCK